MLYVYFVAENNGYTYILPFNRTIIIKQVGMNRAMIGIDLQKVEELVLLHNQEVFIWGLEDMRLWDCWLFWTHLPFP